VSFSKEGRCGSHLNRSNPDTSLEAQDLAFLDVQWVGLQRNLCIQGRCPSLAEFCVQQKPLLHAGAKVVSDTKFGHWRL